MWQLFENLETILGFIGSIFSFATFFVALRVRSKVNEILDRTDFREKYQELSGTALGFLYMLSAKDLDTKNFKIQVFDFTASLKAKYSFFPRRIKKVVLSIEKFDYEQLNVDNHESLITLRQLLVTLTSYLEKEAKQ